jgi:hypothetical protein
MELIRPKGLCRARPKAASSNGAAWQTKGSEPRKDGDSDPMRGQPALWGLLNLDLVGLHLADTARRAQPAPADVDAPADLELIQCEGLVPLADAGTAADLAEVAALYIALLEDRDAAGGPGRDQALDLRLLTDGRADVASERLARRIRPPSSGASGDWVSYPSHLGLPMLIDCLLHLPLGLRGLLR